MRVRECERMGGAHKKDKQVDAHVGPLADRRRSSRVRSSLRSRSRRCCRCCCDGWRYPRHGGQVPQQPPVAPGVQLGDLWPGAALLVEEHVRHAKAHEAGEEGLVQAAVPKRRGLEGGGAGGGSEGRVSRFN